MCLLGIGCRLSSDRCLLPGLGWEVSAHRSPYTWEEKEEGGPGSAVWGPAVHLSTARPRGPWKWGAQSPFARRASLSSPNACRERSPALTFSRSPSAKCFYKKRASLPLLAGEAAARVHTNGTERPFCPFRQSTRDIPTSLSDLSKQVIKGLWLVSSEVPFLPRNDPGRPSTYHGAVILLELLDLGPVSMSPAGHRALSAPKGQGWRPGDGAPARGAQRWPGTQPYCAAKAQAVNEQGRAF